MGERRPDLKERKERQAAEGAVAMAQYMSDAEALKTRTAKLRAERLAREAASPPAATKKRAKKKLSIA